VPEEIEKAGEILGKASNGSPLPVARYFEALPEVNKDNASYRGERSVRANPVAVAFLGATTNGVPGSYQVAWCSAFANWCLHRAEKNGMTSATAQSFICYSSEATAPVTGDIAVCRKTGGTGSCTEAGGHVGFYVGEDEKRVTVLGSNQGPRRMGSLSEAKLLKKRLSTTFHSERKIV